MNRSFFSSHLQSNTDLCKAGHGGIGSLVIIAVVFLLVAAGLGGGWYWSKMKKGKLFEQTIQTHLSAGNAALEQGKLDEAFQAFLTARGVFDEKVFQTYRSWSATASPGIDLFEKNEIDQLLVTVSLFKLYNEAFQLKSAGDWAEKAEQHSKSLTGTAANDVKKRVATAKGVANLVELLRQKKFEQVLKDLLNLEKSCQPGDNDFFVMEVRLLIACGKALKQQDITTQARKLLFFLQFEADLTDPRLDQLWSLLGQ